MKKTITLLLASLVATTGILARCGKKKTDHSTSSNSTTTSTNEVTSAVTSQTTSNPTSTIPPDSFVEVG